MHIYAPRAVCLCLRACWADEIIIIVFGVASISVSTRSYCHRHLIPITATASLRLVASWHCAFALILSVDLCNVRYAFTRLAHTTNISTNNPGESERFSNLKQKSLIDEHNQKFHKRTFRETKIIKMKKKNKMFICIYMREDSMRICERWSRTSAYTNAIWA